MRSLDCLRCDTKMEFLKRENVQLGKTGWFAGDLSNLLSGAMELEIYSCPKCGKVEFFQPFDGESTGDELPKRTCPKCGRVHDIDYPKCPSCKFDYNEK